MITLLGSQDRLPITLDEIKSACGITVSSIDSLITGFISTACVMNGNCRWSRWSVTRNPTDSAASFLAQCNRLGSVIKIHPNTNGVFEVEVGPDPKHVAKARKWLIRRIMGANENDIRKALHNSQVPA